MLIRLQKLMEIKQDCDDFSEIDVSEENLNQKQLVVSRLIQKISSLSHDIELDYLKKKWLKNPDGSKYLSPEELAIQACIKVHQQSNQFDDMVDKLKRREVEIQALIMQRLKMLEESD